MTEWMVDIESEDIGAGVDDLERFSTALDAARGITGAAASLNLSRGALAASYSVNGADAAEAAAGAVAVFRDALRRSGLGDSGPTKVSVEQLPVAEPLSA
jgi:hypothetical protein